MTGVNRTDEPLLGLLSRRRSDAAPADKSIDATVIRLSQLRAEGGPAVAVVKVARDLQGATVLRTQRSVVAEIVTQSGLDAAWRDLVPRILSFDERPDATVCVESYRPGITLTDALADSPHRLGELTALALGAVGPLHRATTRSIVVDQLSAVRQWVVDPVNALMPVCIRRDASLLTGLEWVKTTLTRAIVGRRMSVCWTHGDYTPESVRLAGLQGPVNRIVAWHNAREDRPALVDTHLMILAASCQVEGVDLGTLVGRRVTAGGLSDAERDALNTGLGPGAGDSQPVDERVAILLAWLQHVVTRGRADTDQANDDVFTTCVAPVLEAAAALCGSDDPTVSAAAQS